MLKRRSVEYRNIRAAAFIHNIVERRGEYSPPADLHLRGYAATARRHWPNAVDMKYAYQSADTAAPCAAFMVKISFKLFKHLKREISPRFYVYLLLLAPSCVVVFGVSLFSAKGIHVCGQSALLSGP
jgi:hypothetical protein